MPEGFPQRPPEPPEVTSSESGSDDGDGNSSSDEDVVPSSSASASTSCAQPPSSLPQPAFTNIYDDSDEDDDGEPPSHLPTPEKFVFLQQRVAKLKVKRTHLRKQRDEAPTHAILAGNQIKSPQGQLNAKKKDKGSRRVVHTQSRILTTAEGRAAAQQQKDARDEKSEKAVQSKIRKDDAAAVTRARHVELGPAWMSFSGGLKQQKAPKPKDLAWPWRSMTNVALKTDKRSIGLFGGKRKRAAAQSDEDEPEPGPSTTPRRRRLNNITNLASPSPRSLPPAPAPAPAPPPPRSLPPAPAPTPTPQTETFRSGCRSPSVDSLPGFPSWLPSLPSPLSIFRLQSSRASFLLLVLASLGLI
ncbi:hypothetical protein B0H13DRAFT_1896255 [Mycena leptocephala]|nr:hypothetical protein B0H13DRAFT_1896255 [Mycena leptocephala]